MTNEEAIQNLRGWLFKGIDGMTNERLGFIEGWFSKKDEEVFRMAIKALEQEPFINKPCVAYQACHEDKVKVLDKIRAEIKHFMYDVNPSSSESDYACNYILDILNKYKAESEE